MIKLAKLTREHFRYWAFVLAFRLFLSVLPVTGALAMFAWIVIAPNKADWIIAFGGIVLILIGLFFGGIRLPPFEDPQDVAESSAGEGISGPPRSDKEGQGVGDAQVADGLAINGRGRELVFGRFWPLILGLGWCLGVFLMQLIPLNQPEVLYAQTPAHAASWAFLILPLAVILWMCLHPPGKAWHERGVEFAWVILWLVLMAGAHVGATRLGQAFDAEGQIQQLHSLEVTDKQEYSRRDQFGRKKYHDRYISTRLDGQTVEFPVDQTMYQHTRVGEGVQVTKVIGKSGRMYVFVHQL